MNYKSADGPEEGHRKIDALCCEPEAKRRRGGKQTNLLSIKQKNTGDLILL